MNSEMVRNEIQSVLSEGEISYRTSEILEALLRKTDELEEQVNANFEGIEKLEDSKPAESAAANEPPKDGSLFVAEGRVVWTEESGGGSRPFHSYVRWLNGVWVNDLSMSIAEHFEDRVYIDQWMALPNNEASR